MFTDPTAAALLTFMTPNNFSGSKATVSQLPLELGLKAQGALAVLSHENVSPRQWTIMPTDTLPVQRAAEE